MEMPVGWRKEKEKKKKNTMIEVFWAQIAIQMYAQK